MPRIVAIVEGHGDAASVPLLIRRIAQMHRPGTQVEVPHPIRIPRTKLLRPTELERAIGLAARQTSSADGIMVLLDADTDCPAQVGPSLLARAQVARPDRAPRVVLAKTEFEAWFIAAARSIGGQRGLNAGIEPPADPESIADAKGWLTANSRPGRPYRETLDQPALTEVFDLQAARAAPSFDKFWRDVVSLL